MKLTIDKFGRMVLPKSIRDDFGIKPGDKLEALEEDDKIILKPLADSEVVASREGILVFTGEAGDNLENAIEDFRKTRIIRASGWQTQR